jgi:hypothetical protein
MLNKHNIGNREIIKEEMDRDKKRKGKNSFSDVRKKDLVKKWRKLRKKRRNWRRKG